MFGDSDDDSSMLSSDEEEEDEEEEEELDENGNKKTTILDQVTRNTLVRAIWHCKMKKNMNTSNGGGFHAIYNTMTMQELQMERAYMRRMGFMEIVRIIDKRVEDIREAAQAEKAVLEKQLIDTRLKGLERSQAQRLKGLNERQENEKNDLFRKFAHEESSLLKKHQRAYAQLVEETANRATGGILQSDSDTAYYMSKQNKSASYKTRKPGHEVIRFRKSAQRLREMGRREEALEFEARAAKLDEEAELKWRSSISGSITSSAWGGAKSKLEQLIDTQQKQLKRLKDEHDAKLRWIDQKHELQQTTIRRTMVAERTKVITMCKKQAKKRQEADAQERLKEVKLRKKAEGKSDGMKNISKNILSGMRNYNESDDEGEEGETKRIDWVAPTRSGLDYSAPLVGAEAWEAPEDLPVQRADLMALASGGGGGGMVTTSGDSSDTPRYVPPPLSPQHSDGESDEEAEEEQQQLQQGENQDEEEEEEEEQHAQHHEQQRNQQEEDEEDEQERGEGERHDTSEQRDAYGFRESAQGLDTPARERDERHEDEAPANTPTAQAHRSSRSSFGQEERTEEARAPVTQREQTSERRGAWGADDNTTVASPRAPIAPGDRSQHQEPRPSRGSVAGSQTRAVGQGPRASAAPTTPEKPRIYSPDARASQNQHSPSLAQSATERMLLPEECVCMREAFLPMVWCSDTRATLRMFVRNERTRSYVCGSFQDLGLGPTVETYLQFVLFNYQDDDGAEVKLDGEFAAAEHMLACVYLPILFNDNNWRVALMNLVKTTDDALTGPNDLTERDAWLSGFVMSTHNSKLPMLVIDVSTPSLDEKPLIVYGNNSFQSMVGNGAWTSERATNQVAGKFLHWLDASTVYMSRFAFHGQKRWRQRRIQAETRDGKSMDVIQSYITVYDTSKRAHLGVIILLPLPTYDSDTKPQLGGTLELLYEMAAVTLLTPSSTDPANAMHSVHSTVERNTWSLSVNDYNELLRSLVDLYYKPAQALRGADDEYDQDSTRDPPMKTPRERFIPFALVCGGKMAFEQLVSVDGAVDALGECLERLGVRKLLDMVLEVKRTEATAGTEEEGAAAKDCYCKIMGTSPKAVELAELTMEELWQDINTQRNNAQRILTMVYLPVLLSHPQSQRKLIPCLANLPIPSFPTSTGGTSKEEEAWTSMVCTLGGQLSTPILLLQHTSPGSDGVVVWGNKAFSTLFNGGADALHGVSIKEVEGQGRVIAGPLTTSKQSSVASIVHQRLVVPRDVEHWRVQEGEQDPYARFRSETRDVIMSYVPVLNNEGELCRTVVFTTPVTQREQFSNDMYAMVGAFLTIPRTTGVVASVQTGAPGVAGGVSAAVEAYNECMRVLIDLAYPPYPSKDFVSYGAQRGGGAMSDVAALAESMGVPRLVKSRVVPPATQRRMCESFLPLAWYTDPSKTLTMLLGKDSSRILLEGFCKSMNALSIFSCACKLDDSIEKLAAIKLLASAYLPRFLTSPQWMDMLLETLRDSPSGESERSANDDTSVDTSDAWAANFVHIAPYIPATTVLIEVEGPRDLSVMWLQPDVELGHRCAGLSGPNFLAQLLAANASSNPIHACVDNCERTHMGVVMYVAGHPEYPLVQCVASWVPIMSPKGVRFVAGFISVVDAGSAMVSDTVATHAALVHLLPENIHAKSPFDDSQKSYEELERIKQHLLKPALPSFVVTI